MEERNPADHQKLIQDVREAVKKSVDMSSHFHSRECGQTPGDSLLDTGSLKFWQLPLSALKFATADVEMYSSKIGGPVPEPPTLRGRMGAVLVRIVRRVLWWHTLQLRNFLSVLNRRHQRELDAFDVIEAVLRQVEERCRNLEAAQLRVQSSQVDLVKLDELKAVQAQIAHLSNQLANGQQAARPARHDIESEKSQLVTRAAMEEVVAREVRSRLEQIRKEISDHVRESRSDYQDSHKYDALYVAFENKFRGPRDEIKERQRVYIPMLKEAGIGNKETQILDLGCGRGEWLEILREEGLDAHGVDRNTVMVSQCRELGLNVREEDLLDYLRSLPGNTLNAVTAFHVVEHLPFEVLISVMDETMRVLRRGGMAIFETPNPNNLLVAARDFYLDPTHLHPLPGDMLRFFLEARGFRDVQITELNPGPESAEDDDTTTGRFDQYFCKPRDYAAVGRKP